jgi:nitroreductase
MEQAVAFHHAPSSSALQPLSRVVMAADAIAHALDLSMDDDDVVPTLPDGLWKQLGLDAQTLLGVFAAAEKQFEGASGVLNF